MKIKEIYDIQATKQNKNQTSELNHPNSSPFDSILFKFGHSSTNHAIKNLSEAENVFQKILWILFSLLSVIATFYFISNTLISFYEHGVVTKVKVINEFSLEFPSVMICNLNPFVTTYAKQYVDEIFLNYSIANVNTLLENKSITFDNLYSTISVIMSVAQRMRLIKNYTDTEQKRLGYSIDETIIKCRYNKLSCNLNSDFKWHYSLLYGNCFMFNHDSKKYKLTTQPGILNGLEIEMFVGEEEDLIKNFTSTFLEGARIFISNRSFILGDTHGIEIATNTHTNINVQRLYTKLLPDPYSNCLPSASDINNHPSFIYKEYIKQSETYNFANCKEDLINQWIISKCNCSNIFLHNIFKVPACLNFGDKKRQCADFEYDFYLKNNLAAHQTNLCPNLCENNEYSLTLSSARYPSDSYLKILKKSPIISTKYKNVSDYKLRQSVCSFRVYYESLSYTAIDEVPEMTFISLVSNIGGTFGLFMGASLLSFIEIFDFLIGFIKLKFTSQINT
jgi:hypothetical protein